MRTKKSQKRSKTIFLIILIAALISVTGTYAWFSTQRDVEIVGFRINVEIAENLEISLDGEHWTHTINIEDMRQFYGTYVDSDTTTEVFQAKKDQNRNYVPIELLPVSTIGNVTETGEMVFTVGDVRDNTLSNVKKCSESDIAVGTSIKDKEKKNDQHPYLVFDMYLRNLSRLSAGNGDQVQLNTGSYASAAAENTGLEYSVRVGFLQYGETVSIHETDDETKTLGEKIRGIEADGNEAVTIWEPNSKFHIPYVVSNDDRVASKISAVDTYSVISSEDATPPATIEKIKSSDNEALSKIYTNKPTQLETEEAIEERNYVSTELLDLLQVDGTTPMKLEPNTITKVRVYIWLEGQDPDCIDLASTGDELLVTLRLIKPKSNAEGAGTSYAD